MTVYAEDDVNQIKISRDVKNKVKSLEKNLPKGYSLVLVRDTTEYLSKEIQSIVLRIIYSIFIILFFIFLINRQWRYLFIIVVSLIANISIAFIFYFLFAVEIHLYSLAGLIVSFGILVDNSILMLDHLRTKNNRKVFLAILAATFTTLGALSIIFFLDENIRDNLIDFAVVLLINLIVSLGVSFFFIPSLLERLPLRRLSNPMHYKRKRKILNFSCYYSKLIFFSIRFKKIIVFFIIIIFGLPVFLLPNSLDGDAKYVSVYNKFFGSDYYQKVRPTINKVLGGTLRLFIESDFVQLEEDDIGRTELKLSISMPDGATVGQTNIVAEKIENHLSQYKEIDTYFTNIDNVENARITIVFKPEFDIGFPEFLKNELITLATTIGGCDITIRGVGEGFSNKISETIRSSRISITGYNYETILIYAKKIKESLSKNPRIEKVFVNTGRRRFGNKIRSEYIMNLDKEAIITKNSSVDDVFRQLNKKLQNNNKITNIIFNGGNIPVVLLSSSSLKTDIWEVKNDLNGLIKLKDVGEIRKEQTSGEIKKVNQEFRVTIEYDFIGSYQLGNQILNKAVNDLNLSLPLGYKASSDKFKRWDPKKESQYSLILIVILIIYFVCAILLESLLQPLVIILIVPLSFIGVFLTFNIFEIKFDQGGYASFLLLCGLVVNSSLYIINDYNNIPKKPSLSSIQKYVKAYNSKIIPILLTIFSTILGLVPFLISDERGFWFALAAGTIGGLAFSIPILLIYLPVFLLWRYKAVS